ncbi:hypothetical protein HMPREF2656_02845 [Corynebacterium sp. HMSC034B08]|uniref:IS3 family transposase n=1 Tax=Corynebacterium sp. HMSC034B08 TaxID=1715135 RepID=UPI0008A83A75|nr:IS3 family transposase [Corynebacterium sp. HMSC034B08]OHO28130.1 hypothetical protein HMPREF2656_02845 [Corynebacterium sp. HMSC034B08]
MLTQEQQHLYDQGQQEEETLINQLVSIGYSKTKAMGIIGVSRSRVFYQAKPRPRVAEPVAYENRRISRLADTTVERILELLDANPHSGVDQVFYAALNNGIYLASLRSFYRVAKAHGRLLYQRHNTKAKQTQRNRNAAPPHVRATAPGQVLCWDITFLRGEYVGQTFACHMVIDLYSRAIVGCVVAEREDSRVAEAMFDDILTRFPNTETVHSDNGNAMTSKRLGKLFAKHGVTRSFNRPHTSNDNPHTESVFHTMKGRTYYPKTFKTLGEARTWLNQWVPIYNATPHSGINYYPPQAVLDGTWINLKHQREQGIQNALHQGIITQKPNTAAGTDIPAEVTIIRTTTQTAPTPQPITI